MDVAECFFDNKLLLNGLRYPIVSSQDQKFTSNCWSHLITFRGIHLKMLTSRHPQIDGLTGIMNRMKENGLRCYCAFYKNDWDKLLITAELSHISSKAEELNMVPTEADLGCNTESPLYLLSNSSEDHLQGISEFKNFSWKSKGALLVQKLSQAQQAGYNSKKYLSPYYKVSD